MVDLPLWKIIISQLGLLHSQLNGKMKNVPNHQPVCIYIYIYITAGGFTQHPVMLRSSPILIIWIIDQHSIKSPFENLLVVQSPIISCQSMFISDFNSQRPILFPAARCRFFHHDGYTSTPSGTWSHGNGNGFPMTLWKWDVWRYIEILIENPPWQKENPYEKWIDISRPYENGLITAPFITSSRG